MVATSALRDYQASILTRLEQAKQVGAQVSAGYLGVVSGGKNLLVNMQEISETLPMQEVFPVPLVKSWFIGMTNVRGVLYAVNDLGELMTENQSVLTANTRILLVSDAVAPHVAILVERLIGLRKPEAMNKLKSRAKAHFCTHQQRYEDNEHKLWEVLDIHKLIESQQFMQSF